MIVSTDVYCLYSLKLIVSHLECNEMINASLYIHISVIVYFGIHFHYVSKQETTECYLPHIYRLTTQVYNNAVGNVHTYMMLEICVCCKVGWASYTHK